MKLEEKTLNKNYIYNGKIINVRVDDALLPNGVTAKREVVEHPGGVCVVAVTDNNEILMVKQFRYPYGEVILEIPAGKRDSKDELPLECGKRELREETGATADEFLSLGELYPTPGYCGEIIWLFAAKGLHFGETDPDDDEFVEIEKVPFQKAVEMILNGEIKDAKTQTAILKLNELRRNGKF
jgi:ADP-ribose pyrophosphatase